MGWRSSGLRSDGGSMAEEMGTFRVDIEIENTRTGERRVAPSLSAGSALR